MKIWITYAWKDNQDGDFDYIVQELKKSGIDAIFDKISLIPGQRLWEQISQKISNDNFDGWGYLITPNSLLSQPCKEELEYAVNRAIASKSINFPLIGLVHGVPFNDVPVSLKVRLCVNLSSLNWKEEIKAGLELRPPIIVSPEQTKYVCKVSQKYNGVSKSTIVEIRPRFGEIMYWRVVVPKYTKISSWGWGPADGSDTISPMMHDHIDGADGNFGDTQVVGFGASDRLSPSIAAKVVFNNELPEFIAFGLCKEPPYGAFGEMEIYKLK